MSTLRGILLTTFLSSISLSFSCCFSWYSTSFCILRSTYKAYCFRSNDSLFAEKIKACYLHWKLSSICRCFSISFCFSLKRSYSVISLNSFISSILNLEDSFFSNVYLLFTLSSCSCLFSKRSDFSLTCFTVLRTHSLCFWDCFLISSLIFCSFSCF